MRRSLVLVPLFVVACGLDVVGIDATSTVTGTDAGPNTVLDGQTSPPPPPPDGGKPETEGGTVSGRVVLTVDRGTAGKVTSDVGGIACPPKCTAEVDAGTKVVLTANGGDDYSLRGWSQASCGRELTCSVTVDAAKTITADFAEHVNYMHTTSQLFTVRNSDAVAGPPKTFTNCMEESVGDLAIDRSGKAYALTTNSDRIFALNLETAACTKLGPDPSGADLNALTSAPDPQNPAVDLLFAAGLTKLYTIDLSNGKATLFTDMGVGSQPSGDIVWLPGFGMFASFLPDGTSGGHDRLAFIDLKTKEVKIRGTLRDSGFTGLGWKGQRLLGYRNNEVWYLDPKNGQASDFNTSNGIAVSGAASGP